MTALAAHVTFYVNDDDKLDLDAVKAKALALDIENGTLPEEPDENEPYPDYTLAQALQVIWHNDPAYFHEHCVHGWTLDKIEDADTGLLQDPWPVRNG